MEFELLTIAHYRAFTVDDLNARRDAIIEELQNEGSKVSTADLAEQMRMCQDEYERRNAAISMRNLQVSQVLGGEGRVEQRDERSFVLSNDEDGGVFATEEYERAFFAYACRGAALPEQYVNEARQRRNDAFTNTADVPVFIPVEISRRIVEELTEQGAIYNAVTKTNFQGGYKIPVADLKVEAHWVGEEAVSEWQKVGADEYIIFNYFELECRIAQTMLTSIVTFSEFQSRFPRLASEAMLRALDQMVIRGTGNGQGLGIVNDPRVENIVYMNSTQMADWKEYHKRIKKNIKRLYRDGVFIMAQGTWDEYVETLSDNGGKPISNTGYNPVTGEEEYRLMGRPVITVDSSILPDYSDAKEDEVFMIYGKLSDYCINTNKEMMQIGYDDWDVRKKKLVAYMVADGKVVDPFGFMLIKKQIDETPNLTVSKTAASTSIAAGKKASDLCTGVVIEGETIRASCKKITDDAFFSALGFSKADGDHFVCLDMKTTTASASIQVEQVPLKHTSASFTNDTVVTQVDADTTGLKVTVTPSAGDAYVRNYNLVLDLK